MKYCDLEDLLVQLESHYRGSLLNPSGNAAKAVFPGPNNQQFFALDELTYPADDRPLVITLGANYTQVPPKGGAPNLPHKNQCKTLQNPPYVSHHLKDERRRLVKCLDHFNNHRQEWFDNGLAASLNIVTPSNQDDGYPSFHMVMTNFCGWITMKEWSVLNKHFGRMITLKILFESSREFQHLDDLVERLKKAHQPVLWVAHGLDSEVPPLARRFFNDHKIEEWIITPNLGSWREIILMNTIIKFGGK